MEKVEKNYQFGEILAYIIIFLSHLRDAVTVLGDDVD